MTRGYIRTGKKVWELIQVTQQFQEFKVNLYSTTSCAFIVPAIEMFKVSISENGLKGEYITALGKIFHEHLDFFLNMFLIPPLIFKVAHLVPLILEYVLSSRGKLSVVCLGFLHIYSTTEYV